MFNKILIANRGEVALRVMRAARELNIKTVAIYSEEDRETLPVKYADEAVCVGPAPASQSYLNMSNIIAAAQNTGAQAIHPGYGFLAENTDFARACELNGIAFIGPSSDCISKMGDKATARRTMVACGVPVTPGTDGICETVEEAKEFAERCGYPVLIKATAGGGGKGMREVNSPAELESQFQQATNEAKAAFGNGDVYLEKLILHPRHIEIQVLADDYDNRVVLCERDCSIQRRHQKLIEEAPSPALDEHLRRDMAVAASRAMRAVDYRNAGTIEFLLDDDDNFYFMEMNTRVQVEHPVSEIITGTDIIKEQIRIAAGEKISCVDRAPFSPNGAAIEMRINAEDPFNNFLPNAGKITKFRPPMGPGVRVDTYLSEGSKISPFYDSLICKLICFGQDREEAISRARRAISEFEIEGVKTTLPFHEKVLQNETFIRGEAKTDFIETSMSEFLE